MKLSRRKFLRNLLLGGTGLVLLDSFWFELFFFETKEFFLNGASEKKRDLRMVQISDLHLQEINSGIRRLARKVNSLKADLIVFTGDSVDNAARLAVLNQFLSLLNPDTLKLAIPGNWEYWAGIDMEALRNIYQNNNCRLLINQSINLPIGNKTISVTGVDDFIGSKPDIASALHEFNPGQFHIVLNHCPQYSDTIFTHMQQSKKPDLILSGHTHGGQINLFGFVPFLPPGSGRYIKGWYPEINLYVSKGIGTRVVPMRLMARAEISVFNILT